ncbi:hypothetical protein OKW13_001087 [Bacillus velezensis]|nr:hypothetical protein [Bacillus velezensis]
MGQQHQFRPGQKAPNNGVYVEIGETGSMVKNPQKIKLTVGEMFPDNFKPQQIVDVSTKTVNTKKPAE